MNIQIEQTKQNLVNNINNSGLPVGVALLIVKDILRELEFNYNQIIMQQYQTEPQIEFGPEETHEVSLEELKEEE